MKTFTITDPAWATGTLITGPSPATNSTVKNTPDKKRVRAPATHRLHVETRPLAGPRHREERERVPLVGADGGAADLNVGARLVLVPSAHARTVGGQGGRAGGLGQG